MRSTWKRLQKIHKLKALKKSALFIYKFTSFQIERDKSQNKSIDDDSENRRDDNHKNWT